MSTRSFLAENVSFLAAGLLLTFTSSFGQTFFISVFAGEIRAEFGLSHAAWGGIYTAGTAVSALVMIWAGALTDVFRVRHLGAIVTVLLALSCLSMASVPNAVLLIGVIFALRLTGQGMMSHLAVVAMARWFVATRGKALSVSSLGVTLGQAVLPVTFVALLAVTGWRALWVMAALMVLATLPLLSRLLRAERTPQSVAETTSAVGMNGLQWTRGGVARHWLFWLMFPALLGPSAWGTALFFQQVHLTEVRGWELIDYVALLPLYTVATIAATFASGAAIDRVGTARLMPYYLLPFVVGFGILGVAQTLWGAAVGLVAIGLGQGGQTTLPAAFWAEFYGTRHLGGIKALSTAIMVFGSAIGPGVTGVLIDAGLDFPQQMLGMAVYFIAATWLVTLGISWSRPLLPRAA